MAEDDQDGVFRGPGNICAPAVPLPLQIGLQMQQQLLENAQQMTRAMCSLNPFLRPFIR